MGADHHHDHGHAHGHFGRAFAVGAALNTAFVVMEVACGLAARSLALVADAGHNLGDVFGLLLAWGTAVWALRPPTARRTYGWRRSSVLAALCNAVLLLVGVCLIAWEALLRFRHPVPVRAGTMMWVPAVGILVNGATAALFVAGRKGDLNVRAAFVHNAGDAVISAGVVVAGALIRWTGWLWLDPAVSLALAGAIAAGTWGLLRDSVNLALDAVPAGIDEKAVHAYLAGLGRVADVHHLHIWGLSTNEAALTAHVVLEAEGTDNDLLRDINAGLRDRFGIGHVTIQFESAGPSGCAAARCLSAAE